LQPRYSQVADGLVAELKRLLGERLVSVVFFGSVARGEARRDSDIDVLVVAEGLPKGRFARQDLFMQAESGLKLWLDEMWQAGYAVDFSPIMLTPEEANRLRPLYLDMVDDAVIRYDRDGFFHSVLDRLRELGAKRVKVGKLWYWDLKPDLKFGEVVEIE